MDMSRFNINQLTKEMVVARLSQLTDPHSAAAEVTKKTLLITLKEAPPRLEGPFHQAVTDIFQGAMTGILLKELDLSRGALVLLHVAAEVASETGIDPSEMMSAALVGIADISRFTDRARMHQVSKAIDTEFMGAGEVFVSHLKMPQADMQKI
jgi:hypothetical protein